MKSLNEKTINIHIFDEIVPADIRTILEALAIDRASIMTRHGPISYWCVPPAFAHQIITTLKKKNFKETNWENLYEI